MSNIFDLFKKISSSSGTSTGAVEYLLVGLGNPGREYERTRHNAGFMALDYIAGRCGARLDRAKFSALVGEADINGKRVLLMKPQTYMNSSGEAVSAAAKFYKIPAEKVIVISDDITLDVGRLRVRGKGSHGGHNGLKDIIRLLGTDSFPRLRIGVGLKPHPDYDVIDWVLGTLSSDDIKKTASNYEAAFNGLEKMLHGDIEGAMQICNGVK